MQYICMNKNTFRAKQQKHTEVNITIQYLHTINALNIKEENMANGKIYSFVFLMD